MAQSYPMNGGNGKYSYTNNSTMQRNGANAVKDLIKEAVMENLDVEKLLNGGTRFAVADLGCSVGPNTFYAVENLIEAVESKCHKNKNLEFQVFFNDQIGNDFNTLFAALPRQRNYFAAAVAGSFHGGLFPNSSIHIAYSSGAMNWLSKVPEAVTVKGSPAWNGGRIHYTGASEAVAEAYKEQFEEDMGNFLRCRAQEIAAGGMLVTIMGAVPNRDARNRVAILFTTTIEPILIDMVKEGLLRQEQVDSFNIPIVFPCIEDMRRVIDKNGCFQTVKMEIIHKHKQEEMTSEGVAMHLRAVFEGVMANHFGNEIFDQVFERAMQRKVDPSHIFGGNVFAGGIFFVLKLK